MWQNRYNVIFDSDIKCFLCCFPSNVWFLEHPLFLIFAMFQVYHSHRQVTSSVLSMLFSQVQRFIYVFNIQQNLKDTNFAGSGEILFALPKIRIIRKYTKTRKNEFIHGTKTLISVRIFFFFETTAFWFVKMRTCDLTVTSMSLHGSAHEANIAFRPSLLQCTVFFFADQSIKLWCRKVFGNVFHSTQTAGPAVADGIDRIVRGASSNSQLTPIFNSNYDVHSHCHHFSKPH